MSLVFFRIFETTTQIVIFLGDIICPNYALGNFFEFSNEDCCPRFTLGAPPSKKLCNARYLAFGVSLTYMNRSRDLNCLVILYHHVAREYKNHPCDLKMHAH